MSAFSEILAAVIGLAQATNPYATITVGALPADDGICMTYATGAPSTTFLDKGMAYQRSVVCNAKNTSQQAAQEALDAIHMILTQTKTYPSETRWQITNIETIAAPSYLGREQNSQWLYGSSLRVKFFLLNTNYLVTPDWDPITVGGNKIIV